MIDDYFSASYSDARANFLSACLDAGQRVKSYRNPNKGPIGESLFMDVTWVGPEAARRVVVVTSATHGVEGFAGSGIQVGLLRDANAPQPGEDTAILIVHAVNPYGFAWLRRVNEDNVDLNRNFVDHDGGNYPENDLFEGASPQKEQICKLKLADVGSLDTGWYWVKQELTPSSQ